MSNLLAEELQLALSTRPSGGSASTRQQSPKPWDQATACRLLAAANNTIERAYPADADPAAFDSPEWHRLERAINDAFAARDLAAVRLACGAYAVAGVRWGNSPAVQK